MQREKKPKDRIGDGGSSAGWTDVSRDSGYGQRNAERSADEKGSKCTVM